MNAIVQKALIKIFGSRNERLLKRYRRIVAQINALEPEIIKLTDAQLKARTQELHGRIKQGKAKLADHIPEAMALIRESMDRNIGMRSVFNPDEKFDPEIFKTNEAFNSFADNEDLIIQRGVPWNAVEIPNTIYDELRQLYPESRPPFRARCFDVQLLGGLVLYEGKIAEMATGEGKTFVAPLACFLRVLEGFHAHVVTVNDYLVRRDALWVKPAFEALGFSVGFIQAEMDPGGDVRRKMYNCSVTYGTNSEFGFDFLRDNMKSSVAEQVQGPLDYCIIDEVDSILIDEARTPLIISGAAHDDAEKYRKADAVMRKVMELHRPYEQADREVQECKRLIKATEGDIDRAKGQNDKKALDAAKGRLAQLENKLAEAESERGKFTQYYEVELDKKSAHLTHIGISAAQEAAGVGSFYLGTNMEWPHLLEQALRAHAVYERDRDYVVERGQKGQMEVVIVDEYTGRKMVGRQWSDGLHQAVEAKERVPIKEETQTLATITLQNFFKLYKKIAGMTGTAQTEAEEFQKIYRLDVVTIPTNRPRIRDDHEDRIYRTEREKWESIIEEIKAHSDAGRPVLVGTTSVEKSEMLAALLTRKYGIQHEVLNAKFHEREAQIVALAGQVHVNKHGETVGNVTIATNMAGRGTDIKPQAETFFDVKSEAQGKGKPKYTLTQRKTGKVIEVGPDSPLHDVFTLKPGVKVTGGLHVIGTERHTARRIDNQLRGRAGRQGDAGSSRFFVSLQDDLMKMFAGDWTIKVLGFLGMQEGEHIEDKRISKGIERAQRKVEERNYMARKNLLDYDEVMDKQRVTFYGMRQRILRGDKVEGIIWEMIDAAVADAVKKYIVEDHVANVVSEWARVNYDVPLEASDIYGVRNVNALEEVIKAAAKTEVETTIRNNLGEFVINDAAEEDTGANYDLPALRQWVRTKYGLDLSTTGMKKLSGREIEDVVRDRVLAEIEARDVVGLMPYVEKLYSETQLSNWVKEKFGLDIPPQEFIEDQRDNRPKDPEVIEKLIIGRAREAYARREVEYPVEEMLLNVFGSEDAPTDDPYRAEYVRLWAKMRFDVEMTDEHVRSRSVRQLRDELIGLQEKMLKDGGAEKLADELLAGEPTDEELASRLNTRFGLKLKPEAVRPPKAPVEIDGKRGAMMTDEFIPQTRGEFIKAKVRGMFRDELTKLEQFVLVQILDQSWKDHLYAMDMLRGGIGLHAFAEKDPRILFKKEGFRYFDEMMIGVRERVTDLIFRARVMAQQPQKSVYQPIAAVHQTLDTYGVGEEVAATGGLAPEPTGEGEAPAPQQGTQAAVTPITREEDKVGRNDPCPCGSGKKYKQCCGAV